MDNNFWQMLSNYPIRNFYTSYMLGILQQNKELSSYKLHQRPKFCVVKLKKKKQILTHNYEQTNGIQLEFFFSQAFGNTTANQRIKHHALQRS